MTFILFIQFAITAIVATLMASTSIINTSETQESNQILFPEAAQRQYIFTYATALPQRVPEILKPPTRNDNGKHFTLVDAHAAVVIDAETGEILFDQHAHQHRSIASLTKLYTAYLVRTSGISLDTPVEIYPEDLKVVGSRVGCRTSTICESDRMYAGEILTVENLLKAMLIASANDAATVLAHHISGSQKEFVKLMNTRARELGLKNSHFCTPSGLDPDDTTMPCYSTAADIGRIAALALHDKLIWELLNTKKSTITSANGKTTHQLVATNRFAQKSDVPGMIGAKTGFTPEAGKSLLMAATHPDDERIKVVAVTLGNPWRWRDIKELFNWTWDVYKW